MRYSQLLLLVLTACTVQPSANIQMGAPSATVTADAGSQSGACKSNFRRWRNDLCPPGFACVSPLDLSHAEFGTNTMTATWDDGLECQFDLTFMPLGANTRAGTGSITGGRPVSDISTVAQQRCASLDVDSLVWTLDCFSLYVSSSAGMSIYY